MSTTLTLVQRAQKLHDKRQFAEAEQLLGQAVAYDPSDWRAYNLLSLCLYQDNNRLEQATDAAEKSVQFAPPNYPWPHEVLSSILVKRNQYDQALQAIIQAIARYPINADYYAMASYLHFQMGQWYYAIQTAQYGLMLDPFHKNSQNWSRGAAERMGQSDEATNLIGFASTDRPYSLDEQVQRGWALFSKHRYSESQSAFADAIRLDSSNRFAQHSLLQTIVADNTFYRSAYLIVESASRGKGVLGYWPFIAASCVAFMSFQFPLTLDTGADAATAYIVVLLMAWIIQPIFTFAIWLHPYGRLVICGDQIRSLKWIATIFSIAMCTGATWYTLGNGLTEALSLGLMIGSLIFPIVTLFVAVKLWARKSIVALTAIYLILCLATILLTVLGTGSLSIVGLYSLALMSLCQMIDYFQFKHTMR